MTRLVAVTVVHSSLVLAPDSIALAIESGASSPATGSVGAVVGDEREGVA